MLRFRYSLFFIPVSMLLYLVASAEDTEVSDPTGMIFGIDTVMEYHLEFYVDNWEDSLTYNYEHGEEYMPARFICGDIVLDSIGVRYKGNSSYTMSMSSKKKPLKFKFNDYKNYTFYSAEKLNFVNCVRDPSFMRETIAYYASRKYMPASRTAYANIYIEGELIGFYIQVEQVGKPFLARNFKDNGFNLYKVGDDGAGLNYLGEETADYESLYDLKTNEDENDWSRFITMVERLNNASDEEFVDVMDEHLNLDRCIQHLALSMVISHFDSYIGSGRNYYFYDDVPSGRFQFIPWDHDQSFGVYGNGWDVINADILDIPNLEERSLTRRIIENDSLKQVYLNYIKEMVNGPLSLDSVSALVERIKPVIDSHVEADVNNHFSYDEFLTNIEEDVSLGPMGSIPGVKSFISDRGTEIRRQLDEYSDIDVKRAERVKPTDAELSLNKWGTDRVEIEYSLKTGVQSLEVSVYNIKGEVVKEVYQGEGRIPKVYQHTWDISGIAAGIYFVSLKADHISVTKSINVLH